MAESSPTPDEITRITAPLLFGPLVNWGLYGALCVQSYVYSYNFPNDSLSTKMMVYFAFALETTQTALTGADVYYWFVEGFGDVERLHNSHYAPIDIPIISAVISLLVQMYFCYRIWKLTRNVWLCAVITITSVASATGAAWGGLASIIVGKYAVSKIAIYLWSVPSALSDIMIATAMTLLLRRTRASEGSLFSRFVLGRVVRLTIETNVLTATVAISSIVLYAGFPNDIYYTFTAGIIGKLYSNTLLVSLNNRIYFRDRTGSTADGDTSRFTVSSRIRTPGKGSIHISRAETQLRSPVEVFKLETITHTRDVESGKGDSASMNSDPSHAPGYDIKTVAQSSAPGRE